MTRNSSTKERPLWHRPRRLADWLNPTGARKVHSLVDKVYQWKNLELAWRKVKANHGAGGVDGQSIEEFEAEWETHLRRLHEELKTDTYRPQPVRQKLIPKPGQPGKQRPLGIPTVVGRLIQQAVRKAKEYVASGRRWVLRLIRRYLQAEVTEDGVVEAGREGTCRLCCRTFFLLSLTRNWRGVATNGRGPWWNAGAPHMSFAFPKRFFDHMGLVSLLDRIQCLQNNS